MAGNQPSLLCWELETETLKRALNWETEWFHPESAVALHLAGGGKEILIKGLEGLQAAYLCDLAGPEERMLRSSL
jgi:hypothetical protein